MVNPIDDRTPLQRPLHLDPQTSPITAVATIGDSVALILEMERAGTGDPSDWTLAFSSLFAANDQPGDHLLLQEATEMMADALRRAGMLQDARPGPRAANRPGNAGEKASWFTTLGLRRRSPA